VVSAYLETLFESWSKRMKERKRARAFSQAKTYAPGSSVLSQEELQEFLASPDSKWLVKIAYLDKGGWPAVVPVKPSS
jgi:hypothetical protein